LASAKVFSDSFESTLCRYLRSNHSFVTDVKQDRRRKSVSDASVEAARREKNRLKKISRRRGSTPQDRRDFYGRIRSHSRLRRIHEQVQRNKDATFQERSYLHNFYNYAKEAIAGTIGSGDDSLQFPVEVANRYYPGKYQVPVRLQRGQLSWVPYLPEEKIGHVFDMSPITLGSSRVLILTLLISLFFIILFTLKLWPSLDANTFFNVFFIYFSKRAKFFAKTELILVQN
jgi:hypothetical protein